MFFSAITTILRSELPRKTIADLIITSAWDVRFPQITAAITTSSFFLQTIKYKYKYMSTIHIA